MESFVLVFRSDEDFLDGPFHRGVSKVEKESLTRFPDWFRQGITLPLHNSAPTF